MKFQKVILTALLGLLTLALLTSCNFDHTNDSSDEGVLFSEGLEFASNNDGTCLVSGIGTCKSNDIIIPETSPSGEKVIGVGNGAFLNCGNIRSVTLPKTSTMIGESAFWNCTSLESINIPDTVTSIGGGAFTLCLSLENVTIPDGVTSIGGGAFGNCISIETITIPDGVTSIAGTAFVGCTSLEEINIPETVTSIGASAFQDCTSLVSITIPSSVTKIERDAFMGCRSLVEVCNKSKLNITTEGYSFESLGWGKEYTYLGSYALHIITDESESCVKRIGDFIFYDDGNQVLFVKYIGKDREVTVPTYNNGEDFKIHSFAFDRNDHIAKIKLPEGVVEIKACAFSMCNALTGLTIPSTVTLFDENAIDICVSLFEICNKSSLTIDFDRIIADESESCLKIIGDYIFYDDGNEVFLVKYLSDEVDVKLPEYNGGEEYKVYDYAFLNYYSLNWISSMKKLEIPDFVTGVGDCTFSQCALLENIIIGDGITIIELNKAFPRCSLVKYIELGKNVSSVGNAGINFSDVILSISVDEENQHLKSIDGNLYSKDGKSLIKYAPGKTDTSFVIPDGVTSIERCAFQRCNSLTTIVIPEGVTTIGMRAFIGCNSITKIVIPKSVKTVGEQAFSNLGPNQDNPVKTVYYTGTKEEWKALRQSNSSYSTGLPSIANYEYVYED